MRILQEEDRQAILDYVSAEPEMNLFLIGDLENFGVCSERVNYYVHEERGRWDFLILRFLRSFIIYSPYADYNAEEATAFLKIQETDCISGKKELLEKIAPAFPQWTIESTYMSRLDRVEAAAAPLELEVRLLTQEDVPEAVDLLIQIKEFSKTYQKSDASRHVKEMQEEMAAGSKRVMGGYVNGRLMTIASTSAENARSAMITGVATDPEARRKGYASCVAGSLCEDCLRRGKEFLCLFYSNPAAGRIYKRIGFEELGLYSMLR